MTLTKTMTIIPSWSKEPTPPGPPVGVFYLLYSLIKSRMQEISRGDATVASRREISYTRLLIREPLNKETPPVGGGSCGHSPCLLEVVKIRTCQLYSRLTYIRMHSTGVRCSSIQYFFSQKKIFFMWYSTSSIYVSPLWSVIHHIRIYSHVI